ncbi:MAG: hypothetical protein ABI444_13565 [Candidatus Kapaibacterium sp.]|jgi:hypothetical protein
MRMQAKGKELVPGTEEPSIRISTPLSRLQVSSVQEALRETGWKYSDKFFAHTTSSGVRPTFKMTVYQAKVGLKRSEVMDKLHEAVGSFKVEQAA